MRTVAIIQARMGSARLPGKVMKGLEDVVGKPMLWHIIDRLSRSSTLNGIYLATSKNPENNPIRLLCAFEGVRMVSGSENNVLLRYYEAASRTEADIIVRVTGDCPLVDPVFVDELVNYFKDNDCDYVDAPPSKGLIHGLNVEVFSREALERAFVDGQDDISREHVTPYIYRHPEIFKVLEYDAEPIYRTPDLRLCVDTAQDLALIREIYKALYVPGEIINTKDAINYLIKHPELAALNRDVQQVLVSRTLDEG
ncbi:3-deoxy-manno-octulosonate cytidylyltransferase [Deferribacterales bacterium]|nr:3-deoxy-manno-octulosonate cytidylyltransferase [Deferribacterales bacterium]